MNAELFKKEYPLAYLAVLFAMYMDDVLKSIELRQEAIQLAAELPPLHAKCGMKICKFECNDVEVMKTIPKELHSTKVDLEKETGSIFDPTKVLGIIWDANTDNFKFKSKFAKIEEFFDQQKITDFEGWTKSLILRFSATVYDPLGLISPFTVRSRKILQRLWQEKLCWTDLIPASYEAQWCVWLDELLNDAQKLEIPRSFYFGKGKTYSLHVFVDASTEAYAAAVYVRVKDSRGEKGVKTKIESYLVTSKARVTPTKAESVSRLELNSAVIGLRLGHAVAIAYEMDPKKIHFWTDSMNVLHWINTPANRLKTFVSNRIGQIQSHSDSTQWRHVPTDQNPADTATRDISLQDLIKNKQWWKGPEFLLHSETNWPPEFKAPSEPTEAVSNELKKLFCGEIHKTDLIPDKSSKMFSILNPERFSVGKLYNGFQRLLNITMKVFAFLRVRDKMKPKECEEKAKRFLVSKAQQEDPFLQNIIDQLANNEALQELGSLKPFLDEYGVLRSDSRLRNTEHIPYGVKCPMILTKQTYLAKLIAQAHHHSFEHPVSRNMAKNKVREAGYLILGLDNLFRTVESECVICKERKNQPYEQQMAAIPGYRFEEPLHAFSKTGLDFAGPFSIKQGRAKARLKSYILVFTCLQTRAVHLEATLDQSIACVMNALSRFVDMRGLPSEILSDNWKSFTSTNKELEHWVQDLDEDLIIRQEYAIVNWRFTPPYGPHHGGIYETMVKATKRALHDLYVEADLNMDEFRTAVSRIAALLNARPIAKVKVENAMTTLTPNHFLFGKLGGAVSTEDLDHPVERWKRVHSLVNQFWKQFLLEYIPLLSKRSKWQKERPNLEVGEVVLQLDPNLPRGQWQMGVVEEVFPGDDGKVRRCRIRTTTGTYERPITKLVPLEFKSFNE